MTGVDCRGRDALTDRQRVQRIMHYQPYDRLPLVGFAYWGEALKKWADEGHFDEALLADGGRSVNRLLGFELDWHENTLKPCTGLMPTFEVRELETQPDGMTKVLTGSGAVILQKPGAGSIPAEVDHLLKDRKSWEELYLPKLQWCPERVGKAVVRLDGPAVPFDQGGRELLADDGRDFCYGLHCGSLYGVIRGWLGLVGVCYLQVDDEPLFDEIVDTVSDLCYRCTEAALASGVRFDYAHFWEDICFKNGPLINPSVFEAKVGPHYKRITDLVHQYGIDIVSLDCDGMIDALIPTWLANGVNTMFPIEVGTWNASIAPWRAAYGRELRGVGGMDKRVFARDRVAVDAEVERLKPLVELGGYIPCPDHRIPPDAEWDNVRYYCDRMRETFG